MEFSAWSGEYARIQRAFGFPFEREVASAARLVALRPDLTATGTLATARERLAGREVIVVGRAPRAGPPPMWRRPSTTPAAIVAADGATAACLDAGLVPDVIATDLDGPVATEVTAAGRGAFVVVHAHGDNREAIDRWVGEFPRAIGGSWAGPPTAELIDVGGFTDGDRGAYLAEASGATAVVLWGFDFTAVDEADATRRAHKIAKLAAARSAIAWLAAHTATPIERWLPDGRREPYPTEPTGPSIQ